MEYQQDPTLRVVSVMTAGLHGYSSYSSSHEPDVVAHVVERFYEAATPLIFKADGTLISHHGGSVQAVWSAPHEQTEHAARAALAAWEIANLEPFDEMSISVGVGTGSAMVGVF